MVVPWQKTARSNQNPARISLDLTRSHRIGEDLARSDEISPDPLIIHHAQVGKSACFIRLELFAKPLHAEQLITNMWTIWQERNSLTFENIESSVGKIIESFLRLLILALLCTGNSKSGLPPFDVERFIFVVQGAVTLTNVSGVSHELIVDSYAYLPPNFQHSFKCDASATLVILHLHGMLNMRIHSGYLDMPWMLLKNLFYQLKYASLEKRVTEQIVSSTDKQPLLETPGEVFELRKLLPTSLPYDFNIHIMDFQPGEFLNVKEVHYNQHGLLLLEGQGIYRLGDSWYPVEAGDVIWMAPFVPQWYAALGKTRSRYLLYKDANRDPL
uniref:Cupin type-2 domain-containing protein n=1 Tax=Fagus sylvatica TaxID=28930 RepID=A0A2N9ENP3_FAGSY